MPRPPKPWYRKDRDQWCVTIQGKRFVLADGAKNKAEAVRAFHELMAAAPAPIDTDRPTVFTVVEAYLAHANKHLRPRSFAERKPLLERFCLAHGFREVADLRAIHLSTWLDGQTTWKSDWTAAHVVAVIKRPFNWAVKMGIIETNPLRSVSRSTGSPRRPMTDREFAALLRGAPGPRGKPFRQICAFLRLSGMRPGEASALTWANVFPDSGQIVMLEHKTSRKTGRPRVVPITPQVARLLAHRAKGRVVEPTAHVFSNSAGRPWNRCSLSLRLQRARDRTGIPIEAKLYGLRHRFGTTAIVRGVDIKTLAELMGHASTRMTEHYLHLSGQSEHLAHAMRQASRPGPSKPKPEPQRP